MAVPHAEIPHLREVLVFLVTAGTAVPLLQRARINPVLGYLVLGGVIGPFGVGLHASDFPWLGSIVITELDGVRALAELGVIFLLFMIGLELSLDRLWAMRRLVFGLGNAQILVCGAVIGLVAWSFGNSPSASIVLGACLALSSTAIVMHLLTQARRLGTPVGRTAFSILLMQDLAVVPILFLVGVLGASGAASIGRDLAMALGEAVLVIAVLYALGRLVVRPALRIAARSRSSDAFTGAVLLIVIGTAALTGAAGLSMALGAFLAGLVLAETEFVHQIEVNIDPFKGLMLGLFFMSVGMGIDWRVIGQEPGWIIASVAGLLGIKAVLNTGLCVAFGLPRHVALETGLLLAQAGEFAFIVVGLAQSNGVIPVATGQFVLIVVGLTMTVTPFVSVLARRVGVGLEGHTATEHAFDQQVPELEGHVILAGFGRVGRTLSEIFDAEGIAWLALDKDADAVSAARHERRPVWFGDAGRLDVLARARIGAASAVVVTMDDGKAAEQVVAEIRSEHPELPIYARARDMQHARRLREAGVDVAVPETIEGSLQLAGRLLAGLGISSEAIGYRLDSQRNVETS